MAGAGIGRENARYDASVPLPLSTIPSSTSGSCEVSDPSPVSMPSKAFSSSSVPTPSSLSPISNSTIESANVPVSTFIIYSYIDESTPAPVSAPTIGVTASKTAASLPIPESETDIFTNAVSLPIPEAVLSRSISIESLWDRY